MNYFDCVLVGKKLKCGTSVNKTTGEARPWTDVYTNGGSVVRVNGFDSSQLPDMADVNIWVNVNQYPERLYFKFVKVVK